MRTTSDSRRRTLPPNTQSAIRDPRSLASSPFPLFPFSRFTFRLAAVCFLLSARAARADEPAASYIFPAGGQRGTQVEFRVGGLCLHDGAAFELIGPGVSASPRITPTETVWFEGPIIPLPFSQQKEDYPKDYAGAMAIAPDSAPGLRYWRLATSQGATPAMRFVVGEWPEVIEKEVAGEAIPVPVTLPVTINGRIFPREDVDEWSFAARKGEAIRAEVHSARLGYPLEARLVLVDPMGKPLAEDTGSLAGDCLVRVTAPTDGTYTLRIHDVNFSGLQHFVYRLTVTNGPHVERVYPLGGRRGAPTRFELSGQALPAEPVAIALPADGPRYYRHRLDLAGRPTNAFAIELDDLPEQLELEPNDVAAQVSPQAVPAVFNGRIGKPGDVDCWAIAMKRGQPLDVDLRAGRLGSPLEAELVVFDAAGKELARAKEATSVQIGASADTTYTIQVSDTFQSRGGPSFAYRLRIAPAPVPDFRLNFATDAVTLYRGVQAKLRVTAERLGGFAGAIKLDVAGLPEGVTVATAEVPANQPQVELTLAAEKNARIRTARIMVRGTAEIAEKPVTRTALMATAAGGLAAPPNELEIDNVLLAVSMPTPFKVVGRYDITFVPRGSVYRRHYKIDRGGYDGPLVVRMADRQMRHLQGVNGSSTTVPAGATECDYPVYLPPWMELARTSRSCVMAVGVIVDDDGSQHTVSFTSQNQNEQIVALVGPGPLSLRPDEASLVARPDSEVEVALRLARDATVRVPVRIELIVPSHIVGISAEPVLLAPSEERASLRLHFAHAIGPLNMPLVVRATAQSEPPVVAETKLELVAGN
ncbi:MAG TPA: hypothetical protein VND64_24755 [Pirellulales bacterium]|nr:hypothetical protein [Pirellulales bacterium]